MSSINRSFLIIVLLTVAWSISTFGQRPDTTRKTPPATTAREPAKADGEPVIVSFATPIQVESPRTRQESWWRSPAAAALIAAGISLVNVVVVLLFNARSLKQREEEVRLTNRQKDIEEDRRSIYKQLNEFYGPMQQLLAVSKDLALAFKNGRDFSTLIELLEGNQYRANDAVLLAEIMSVTDEIEKLIMTKSGLVDEPDLRQILSRAVAHFRILRLAAKGSLVGQAERFRNYSFPVTKIVHDIEVLGLEDEVDARIVALHGRLERLRQSDPGRAAE